MRTLVIGCLAILLISLPAAAYHGQTRPYVGLNLQFNNPTGDFGDESLDPGDGAANPAAGVEVDVGMSTPQMSAYIGFRGSKFDTDTNDPNYDAEWTANRVIVGVRGNLFADRGYDVIPTIGGGVSLGRTSLEETIRDADGITVIDDHSDTSIGWFLEGGILAYVGRSAALNANLQYHSFGAEFDPVAVGGLGKFDISYVTLQVGVSFLFGE